METRPAIWLSHSSAALVWSGRSPSARLARVNKPLRCRPLEGRRDQKSPLRRCFKPRPPWRAGCAGFASGCRSSVFGAATLATRSRSMIDHIDDDTRALRSRSGRLSGLLSGCPPTDTRPQARAKLGESAIRSNHPSLQEIFASRVKILSPRDAMAPHRGSRDRRKRDTGEGPRRLSGNWPTVAPRRRSWLYRAHIRPPGVAGLSRWRASGRRSGAIIKLKVSSP